MYMNIIPVTPMCFSGRKKELKTLIESFDRTGLFYIEGISGIGKTSIMLKWANILSQRIEYENNILWLECREDWTLDTVLMEINEWLISKGENTGKKALAEKFLTSQKKALYIIDLLNKSKYIIFIDDFQNIPEESEKIFLETLKKYIKNSRIYIISQKSLISQSIDYMDILRIKIKELDREDSFLLLKNFFDFHNFDEILDDDVIIKIIQKAKGHPFILKTIMGLIISKTSSVEYILAENIEKGAGNILFNNLIKNLNSDEIYLLEILSASRVSLSSKDIKEISKLENYLELLSSLEKKIFIEKDQECRYAIHHILKEHIWNNFTKNKKNTLHNILGKYFEETSENLCEAFYHLINAGKPEKAEKILQRFIDDLLSQGYYEEILKKIKTLEEYINISDYVKMIKAVALAFRGNCKEGISILEALGNRVIDKNLLAQIYFSAGRIYGITSNYSMAIDYYQNSLKLFEETGNIEQVIKISDRLSIFYEVTGQTEEAYRLIQNIFTIAENENNEMYLLYALSKKISFLIEKRKFEEAFCLSEKRLAIAEKKGSLHLIHSALINKGKALVGLKRYDEAYKCFESNLILGKKFRVNFIKGASYFGIARVFCEIGNLDKSLEFLKKSIKNYISAGNKICIAISEYNMANVLSEKGNLFEALALYSKVINQAVELSYKKLEIKSSIEILKNRLRIKEEFPSSEEAIRLKKRIPDNLIIDKIDINIILSIIYQRENRDKEQEDMLREALELSEKKGYVYGITKACYIMSKTLLKDKKTREMLRKKLEENLDKLEASQKREFEYLLKKIKDFKEKYVVKIGEEEFAATLLEVNKIRKNRENFDLFIDLSKKVAFEKDRGELDVFRKTNLMKLLLLFIRKHGQELSSEEIYREIWEWEYEGVRSDDDVRKCVSRLRRVIEPGKKNFKYIFYNQGLLGEKGKYYFKTESNFCLIDNIQVE